MIGFLIIIHTIVSILLISVVLMQASQGGGLSGTFGGQAASSILGGQGAGRNPWPPRPPLRVGGGDHMDRRVAEPVGNLGCV